MKLDRATIPIRERSLSECTDLALALYRTDVKQIATLVALFAIPAGVAAYALSHYTEDGLLVALSIFYFVSPVLGATLVAGEGPRVFGSPFRVSDALRLSRKHAGRLFSQVLGPRLVYFGIGCYLYALDPALLTVYVPLAVVLARGSTPAREIILLEGLSGKRLRQRVRDLNRTSTRNLFGRIILTELLFVAIVAVLFVCIDLTSSVLFGAPILFGQLAVEGSEDFAWYLILTDPNAVAVLMALMWVVYPLARLTLFLSYLDLRIRKEWWDIELDFRIEARRLEESL